MLNIVIFQFIASFLLKAIAVKSQVLATPFSFHMNNFLLSLSKIFLLPAVSRLPNKVFAIISMIILGLSYTSYIFTVLSMIVVNLIVIKIYSGKNKMDDLARPQFAGKIGGLLGVLAIPLIKIIDSVIGNSMITISVIAITTLSFAFLVYKELLNSKIKGSSLQPKNILGFNNMKNAIVEYRDVVGLYMLIATFSYFTSNIAFFSGSSKSAIAPCLAILALIFKKYRELFIFLIISFACISFYINSLPIFLLTVITGFLNISTKAYSRNKYKDAYIPHITASFAVDMLFTYFHIISCIFLFIG